MVWGIIKATGKPNVADYFLVLRLVDPQGLRQRHQTLFKQMYAFLDELIEKRSQSHGVAPEGEGGYWTYSTNQRAVEKRKKNETRGKRKKKKTREERKWYNSHSKESHRKSASRWHIEGIKPLALIPCFRERKREEKHVVRCEKRKMKDEELCWHLPPNLSPLLFVQSTAILACLSITVSDHCDLQHVLVPSALTLLEMAGEPP
ncbi:hypothetical protein EJ110_NYTH29557 [Nymphaea thermarum]|nr:hypothetical protein EJ110_NYTH29557 [Nymphaea thermarum]